LRRCETAERGRAKLRPARRRRRSPFRHPAPSIRSGLGVCPPCRNLRWDLFDVSIGLDAWQLVFRAPERGIIVYPDRSNDQLRVALYFADGGSEPPLQDAVAQKRALKAPFDDVGGRTQSRSDQRLLGPACAARTRPSAIFSKNPKRSDADSIGASATRRFRFAFRNSGSTCVLDDCRDVLGERTRTARSHGRTDFDSPAAASSSGAGAASGL
jgi:hypothetical protein